MLIAEVKHPQPSWLTKTLGQQAKERVAGEV
jgi:hypothetical protein